MQHGSLQNLLYASQNEAMPKIGDPATMIEWTDRHPATIIHVTASGKTVRVREDKAIRTDKNGMSETQDYLFTADLDGRERTYRRGKDGRYRGKGGIGGLLIGRREKYHDFSF